MGMLSPYGPLLPGDRDTSSLSAAADSPAYTRQSEHHQKTAWTLNDAPSHRRAREARKREREERPHRVRVSDPLGQARNWTEEGDGAREGGFWWRLTARQASSPHERAATRLGPQPRGGYWFCTRMAVVTPPLQEMWT
jgi:hypothetical protein